MCGHMYTHTPVPSTCAHAHRKKALQNSLTMTERMFDDDEDNRYSMLGAHSCREELCVGVN